MPTIPLYSQPSDPDAWHRVRSPGGYESWHFDAEDVRNDRHLVAVLHQGFVFQPEYLRRYARYRWFPTRVAPPLPEQFPCAHFALYENRRLRWQFTTHLAPARLVASVDRVDVAVGPNRMSRDGSGRFELQFEGAHGPQSLRARFTFVPGFAHPPVERALLANDARHFWVIASPLCHVEGIIQLGSEELRFTGDGYHDHHYGTAPLGTVLRRRLWGRVLMKDSAYAFHVAQPRHPESPDGVHLVETTIDAMRDIPVARVLSNWTRPSRLRLAYPTTLAFDDVIDLHNPRPIESPPFCLRLEYDATCRGRGGVALCEIVEPHRLRLPLLGRFMEMSIDKRAVSTTSSPAR